MKIKVVSDLHLDFSWAQLHNSDKDVVLVVAGDLVQLNHSFLLKMFLDEYAFQYKYIVLVCGNHEFYDGKDMKSLLKQYKYLTDEYYNVFLVEKNTLVLDGIRFLGTTLWSDFEDGNPLSLFDARTQMNDYKCIKIILDDVEQLLTPEIVYMMYLENKRWLYKELQIPVSTVIVTHHAPSLNLVVDPYKTDGLAGAYASNLEDMIFDNPHIKLWAFGHMHSPTDMVIGHTRVLSNPKGYGNQNVYFDPNKIVEI